MPAPELAIWAACFGPILTVLMLGFGWDHVRAVRGGRA